MVANNFLDSSSEVALTIIRFFSEENLGLSLQKFSLMICIKLGRLRVLHFHPKSRLYIVTKLERKITLPWSSISLSFSSKVEVLQHVALELKNS